MAGSLFDRLTRGPEGADMDEDESIRLHLMRMFIARQGSVQALPDYGLPDLNDLTLSRAELIAETCRALQECIAKYEPRLTGVEVRRRPMPDDSFSMGFTITAVKQGDKEEQPVSWHWTIALEGDKIRMTTVR